MMLLLVRADDPDETVNFGMGLGKLNVEFLVCLFEIGDFVV